MIWTAEIITKLKQFTEGGLSCGQIAAQLGVSRNAVIGAMHRLGIHSKLRQGGRPAQKPRPPRLSKPQSRPVVRPRSAMTWPQERVENAPDIITIQADQCHWPIRGEGVATLFCGAPALAKHSYCADHCRRAFNYVPVTTRAEIEIHRRRQAKSHATLTAQAAE